MFCHQVIMEAKEDENERGSTEEPKMEVGKGRDTGKETVFHRSPATRAEVTLGKFGSLAVTEKGWMHAYVTMQSHSTLDALHASMIQGLLNSTGRMLFLFLTGLL